ncbi:hypothetical protein GCM10011360_08120 [Primorskyibacter flagellatus]|uniref:Uncharacterized protein n=1 Tax=Primorskyibacter flagellatus TaxID=1387277 RepID=A0A917A124_9RHOB|nr:hypothetical protein GCM10011360_08120 [Primorskyibacter flagellatus]
MQWTPGKADARLKPGLRFLVSWFPYRTRARPCTDAKHPAKRHGAPAGDCKAIARKWTAPRKPPVVRAMPDTDAKRPGQRPTAPRAGASSPHARQMSASYHDMIKR